MRKWLDLLVGIETGILGGLVMLAWFTMLSLLMGRPWWFVLNLFATEAYGRDALRLGPGWATVAGAAVHLSIAGLVGAVAGLFSPGGRLYGLGIAIIWYILSTVWVWKRIAPLVPVYVPYAVLMSAYFLYGSALGLHSHFRRQLMNKPKAFATNS
jgi:hypothetical protein